MLVTSVIWLWVAGAAAYGGLDRLLERLGGSTEAPPGTALGAVHSTRAPRLRHHHHLQLASNEAQADASRNLFSPSNAAKSTARQIDWKKVTPRKNLDKIWNEYRPSSYKSTGVVAAVVPRGENQEHAHNEVFRHNVKMARETVCRLPQLKVIRVSDHYPSPSKVYMPSCTRLHQCAQDTGCCPPTQKCGPKTTHRVELYFYMLQTTNVVAGGEGKRPPAALGIEKLPFYNHTECECQERTDEMPRDTNTIPHNTLQPQAKQPVNKGCLCPSEYTIRYLANGSCTCDCFDKQRDCTKYKRGKEYFNHQDRLCIATGSCTHPTCDFGVYMKRLGRCPRKHEKYRSWPRYT